MARVDRPTWPGRARVGVVVTVDHDAEFVWYRVDETVRDREKTRSLGEYGARRGVQRVLETLQRHEVPATWFVPGAVVATHPRSVEAIVAGGHEIGSRGWELETLHGLDADAQAAAIERGENALTDFTGTRPSGFRGYREVDQTTFRLLGERGYQWTSMLRGDDRPSWIGGAVGAGLVDIPAPWELEDFPRFAFNYGPPYPSGQSRIAPYSAVLADWIAEFDAYRRHGGLFVLTLEPQSIGKPGRIAILDRLLAHIRSFDDVWIATAGEAAAYWRSTTAPTNADSESERLRTLRERDADGA